MAFKKTSSVAGLAMLLCGAAAPLHAQVFQFTGTRENVNPLLPPGSGRCAPTYFNTVVIQPGAISSTGSSNLGSFSSTQSHCITSAPPTPLLNGQFAYTFRAGDTITGTYSGDAAATATANSFAATENLVITGGTGRFAGASGTITDRGTLTLANGNGNFTGALTGSIVTPNATASGSFATATGVPSAAAGSYATAYGAFSYARNDRTLAAGSFAEATADGASAVGDQTYANGAAATALGQLATANGPAASALGHNPVAAGVGATAVGVRANAVGVGATSVGRLSAATADNATAVGASASAAFAGSTAVGTGATATAANQVALGGTGSAVRVGDIVASTAAQQASSVGVATVDANGVIGRNTSLIGDVAALRSGQTTMQGQIGTLFDLADYNRRGISHANEGVAMALAMESPSLPAGATFAVAGGIGTYAKRVAGTASFAARLAPMTALTAGVGVGFDSGKVGARAGVQHAW